MGDPLYITQPNGATFRGCSCIRDSWPYITRLAVLKKITTRQIGVTQGAYSTSVSKSALTHAGGGVLDMALVSQSFDDLMENCGVANYVRTPADGFSYHSHGIWIGCPHLHAQAQAQVTDWLNRKNALASHAADRDQTRPSPVRNWQQGLAWAKAEIQRIEDDMPLTDTDIDKIATRVWSATFGSETAGARLARAANLLNALLGSSGPTVGVALQDTYYHTNPITRDGQPIELRQEVADIKTLLLAGKPAEIKQQVGDLRLLLQGDVDDADLAKYLAALVAPNVRDAVVAAVKAGGTPEAIGDAVAAALVAAMNPYPKEEQA